MLKGGIDVATTSQVLCKGRGSLEPRPSSPTFHLTALEKKLPDFSPRLRKSGRGKPGFEAGGGGLYSDWRPITHIRSQKKKIVKLVK